MIYKSKRIGQFGRPFILYKFRTMRNEPGPMSTSEDDPRITKLGRFLRKTKIDELPQLWNVLKGDMNLVGPRPEVPEVVELMNEEEKRIILSVPGGITSVAALWNAREEETLKGETDPHKAYLEEIWPTKKRLDIWYVKNKSWKLDLKIILWTIKKLLLRQDVRF